MPPWPLKGRNGGKAKSIHYIIAGGTFSLIRPHPGLMIHDATVPGADRVRDVTVPT